MGFQISNVIVVNIILSYIEQYINVPIKRTVILKIHMMSQTPHLQLSDSVRLFTLDVNTVENRIILERTKLQICREPNIMRLHPQ